MQVTCIPYQHLIPVVEIFRTNIHNTQAAETVLHSLRLQLPAYYFNFDLEDCDRILRVKGDGLPIEVDKVIHIVRAHAVDICLLED